MGGRGQRGRASHLTSDHPVHHNHCPDYPHDQHHHMGVQGDNYVSLICKSPKAAIR